MPEFDLINSSEMYERLDRYNAMAAIPKPERLAMATMACIKKLQEYPDTPTAWLEDAAAPFHLNPREKRRIARAVAIQHGGIQVYIPGKDYARIQ